MDPGLHFPTTLLADWVVSSRWEAVDARAQAAAARSLLNWLGCALGGANDPAVDRLVAALQPVSGRGTSPFLGRTGGSDPATAALVHAFASNILDYDDTHWATAIHPAGTVASALFAWAGEARVSGEELLHAFLLGMEVECRIGMAVSPGHYERGWHITATCGVFGAAVAVGRVMQLSHKQMTWAIGHAATQAGGLVASLGTMAKSLNIAHAARNGLVAAQLARHGMTAHEQALEAKFGFGEVMGPGRLDATLCEGLGMRWECERNTFKPYPCGFLLHPAIVACQSLPLEGSVAVEDIDEVAVAVHPLALVRADRRDPADGMEAKLSLQHAVSMSLLRREAGVRAFTDNAVHDPAIRACRAKVRLAADGNLSAQEARIALRLRDGSLVSREVRCPPGQDPASMSDAALERKVRELVDYGSPHLDADRLLEALAGFARSPDAAALLRLAARTA